MPTKRLLAVFATLSLVLLIAALFDISWRFLVTVNVVALLASLADLRLSAGKKDISFKRIIPKEMERGISYTVSLEITNDSAHALAYRFVDDMPQSFVRSFQTEGSIPEHSAAEVRYETIATVRGKYEIEKIYFRFSSSLGLWEKQLTVELADTAKVIPDLTETKQYLENAQQFLMYEGVKIRRKRSGVGDFSKIRAYAAGDDPRKINWRQTAKLHEVMANDYEPEHGKYITILIDCGRMMGAELKNGNRLEKAMEAALTVAAAALKKGDYVSVLAFSKEIKVFVPPAKGMAQLQTILHAIYNLGVDAVESNYAAVLQYMETVQKKRSLLLLFSDVQTFLHDETSLAYLKRLRKRHIFIMIGIEDQTILKRIKQEPLDLESAMLKSMAQQQMLNKKREKVRWEKQGLQLVEAGEERLAAAAVSHYIEIMNRNLL
ncbi:DUF58 domain-containing protein [Bacillus sp. C11]|nr:DUF58 domain-containing protein [Neobacillus terrae]